MSHVGHPLWGTGILASDQSRLKTQLAPFLLRGPGFFFVPGGSLDHITPDGLPSWCKESSPYFYHLTFQQNTFESKSLTELRLMEFLFASPPSQNFHKLRQNLSVVPLGAKKDRVKGIQLMSRFAAYHASHLVLSSDISFQHTFM